MTRALLSVAALCLSLAAAAQQTSITPSPTPARQPAPAGSRRRSGMPRPATAPSQSQAPAQSSGPAQAPSTAPLGNSQVEIIGNPQKPGQPSDDKPMLPIASVPNSLGLASGTPIHFRLNKTADSGNVRNGDVLDATLTQPLAGLAAGTPIRLTVVQAARAGSLVSYGELSLQVTRIGTHDVLSDIVTALGKEGKKELADSAPATGTEAEFPAGKDFAFPAA